MTILEQLAEREYPVKYTDPIELSLGGKAKFPVNYGREKYISGFIRSAKLAEEFMLWIDNKSPALATSWTATFEIFLTEKLESDGI